MADEKLTQQTADATPSRDDIAYTVNDPGGTPAGRKVEIGTLRAYTEADQETASFTFALTDVGLHKEISNAGATTATIPPNSSVAFQIGDTLVLEQTGSGACTWTAGAGVTINKHADKTLITDGQYSVSWARKTATNTWTVGGELVFNADVTAEALMFAVSDETTALTTGTGKLTFRMPYAFTLTDVRASVVTAPTGAALTIDINEGGTTILSTKLTIDATEKTSETAATPPVISDASLADDAEMTIDIDAVGSTVAGAGLKVYLLGNKA